jgi:hypothetical protein
LFGSNDSSGTGTVSSAPGDLHKVIVASAVVIAELPVAVAAGALPIAAATGSKSARRRGKDQK